MFPGQIRNNAVSPHPSKKNLKVAAEGLSSDIIVADPN